MTYETPGLSFDAKTIKLLADIGLSMDIDQYIRKDSDTYAQCLATN
jgi:hypothetical protein